MTAWEAEYGADHWEPRPRCRETRVIVYPDGTAPCPGCDDCCPELPDEEVQRLREQTDAIYTEAVRAWFRKSDAA